MKPKVIHVGCANPASPASGTVTFNLTGSLATYTCSLGYTLNGVISRYCRLPTGLWDGTDPKCGKL